MEAVAVPAPLLLHRVRDRHYYSTKLFSGLAVLLAIATMAIALLVRYRFYPLLQLSCLISLLFFGALYLRRRLHQGPYQHAWLRRGLAYLAVSCGTLGSLLFFTNLPPAIRSSWQAAVGGWVLLAVFAYFFYRITVLHVDEGEHLQAQAEAALARPVV